MGTLANLVLRALGFGAAVDALDGETSKAYIGSVGMILSGAATLLGGLANLAGELLPLHGAGAYLAFAQGISHDANAALILTGAALISKGIEGVGQRHAIAKAATAAAATPDAEAAPALPSTPEPAKL